MLVPPLPGHFMPRDVYERQDAASPATGQGSSSSEPSSPFPTHHDNTPRIGGSEGAFIGLVVALSLIFLLSSIAIFFLLRNHEPTERDRERRRQHSIRRRGAPHTLPIGLHNKDSSLTEKLGNMFRGRRAGGGWMPAGSEEWDSADEDLHKTGRDETMRVRASEESKRARFVESDGSLTEDGRIATPVNLAPQDTPFHPPTAHAQAPSGDSMYSQESAGFQAAHASYFALDVGARQFSVDSADTLATFAGGTKFKEDV